MELILCRVVESTCLPTHNNVPHSICNRGAGLGHPMDPVKSVQNKNFSGNTKELAKVFGNRIGNLLSFTLTIRWNLASPVKIFPGIIERQHHTDRKRLGLLREPYAGYFCCIVAIRSG